MSEQSQAKEDFSNKNIVLFASRSLGKQGLKNIFETASHNQDVLVVFRGIPKEANLGEAMLEIQEIAVQYDPVPNIIIDPSLFEEYKVEVVPAVVIREESTTGFNKLPKEVAKVFGLSTYDWVMSQIESGGRGDLGVRGPVSEISEPDLIELMKERFAAIDWEEKKEAAKNNFWKNQRFRTLPRATEHRTRLIDPSIYITDDIKAENGAIIASKGDVINPLDITPFTQAVIVFDPLDKEQVALIKKSLVRISETAGVTRLTYIATRFDKEAGWDSYKEATDTFKSPVYLLTPDLQARFHLERVPSVITAKGRRFSIEELYDQNKVEN
nr:TrbC family F-type conjugative pilus assembly protein [Marinomonas algarum]